MPARILGEMEHASVAVSSLAETLEISPSSRAKVGGKAKFELTRLVESEMTILSDSSKEELDSSERLDLLLVPPALGDEIRDGTVEDVDGSWRDVDVLENCFRGEEVSDKEEEVSR